MARKRPQDEVWTCEFCPKSRAPQITIKYAHGSLLDTRLSQIHAHLLTHVIDELRQLRHTKRPPTAYQAFVGKQMKAGKSLQDAAHAWRARTSA